MVAAAWIAPAERTQAQWTSRQLEKEMEAYVREKMKKARHDCARKFAITRLPNNDIDFIARYGGEKWRAYKDCVVEELHLDEQHLPSGN